MSECMVYDDQLVEMVKQHDVLYNKNNSMNKYKEVKQKAWESIAAQLNTDSIACEQRWNILRNRFCTELRNLKFMQTQGDQMFVPQWSLFKSMLFMKNHILPRKPRGMFHRRPSSPSRHPMTDHISEKLEAEDDMTGDEEYIPEGNSESADYSDVQSPESASPHNIISQDSSFPSSDLTDARNSVSALQVIAQKRKYPQDFDLSDTFLAKMTYRNSLPANSTTNSLAFDEDGDMAFARNVMYHLKKHTSLKTQCLIKSEIMQIFAKYSDN